jgi:catalase
MMQGFGVHTFRFVNEAGESCFVKDVQDVKGYSPQAGYQLMPLP